MKNNARMIPIVERARGFSTKVDFLVVSGKWIADKLATFDNKEVKGRGILACQHSKKHYSFFVDPLQSWLLTKYQQRCATENVGGAARVVVKHGYADRANILRNSALMVESKRTDVDWSKIPELLKDIFNLHKLPQLTCVNSRKAMIELSTIEEVERLLKAPRIEYQQAKLSLRRWRPASKTIDPSWLHKRKQWIEFLGIPLHLWSVEVFRKLCSSFGRFYKVKEEMGDYREVSRVKILVDDCDLLKIPNILPLIDEGITYPIRVLPEIDDLHFGKLVEEGDELHPGSTQETQTRSYAEVATNGRESQINRNPREHCISRFGVQTDTHRAIQNSNSRGSRMDERRSHIQAHNGSEKEMQGFRRQAQGDLGYVGPFDTSPDGLYVPDTFSGVTGRVDDTNVEGRGVDGNRIVEDDDGNWGSASSSSSGEMEEEKSEDEELLIDSLQNQNETNSADNVSRVNETQLSENWVADTVIPLGTMLGVTTGYVDGSVSPPPRTLLNSNNVNPEFTKWHKQDQVLLGWILSSLSETVLSQVVGISST
ncbi:hypothetical protein IFM89_010863 [Coptis chinensis]|uniref:DUF4283 domain-containing protein n=1 Tax=Coptis chinensis TaxID=261450 RepID=A0A835HZU5_9MAGN|nr:hypothetical protein IFM89_010863 [Coptis chinensis]